MKIECTCGQWHDLSQTAIVVVVDAYQAGDLTRIAHPWPLEVTSDCMLKAFDDAERINKIKQRYRGNQILIDGQLL
jgi:hypothetical protein